MLSIVVIAASAGGLDPLRQIVSAVPSTSEAAVFVVMHIGPYPTVLPTILKDAAGLPATFALDGALIEAGRVYVAPPDHHVLLERGWMRLSRGPKVNHTRPAADPLFMSAAVAYRRRVMGIVLSGGACDGAEGLRIVKANGGWAFVQDPDEAAAPSMPLAALQRDHPDARLSAPQLAQIVAAFCSNARTLPVAGHH